MIDKDKLREMIQNNGTWGSITAPEELRVNIPDKRKDRFPVWEWFLERKFRFATVAATIAVMIVSAFVFYPKGEVLVISYPYNGEISVELIGSFNRWDRKITMRLEANIGLWKAEVRVPQKGIYEYQFIIDDMIYSAGNSAYRVKGRDGEEKAVMIVSFLAGDGRITAMNGRFYYRNGVLI